MTTTIRKNERSWAIELISQINQYTSNNDLIIKHAGGESTVSEKRGNTMFPDVILYGNDDLSGILQGWELKMPDVPINDDEFVYDAQRKARALGLNSCIIWNFTHVKLYVLNNSTDEFDVKAKWDNLNISKREDVGVYKKEWEKTLKEVLLSVNEFLVSGEIKKTFIGDVLAKISISNLVNENKALVAKKLKDAAINDTVVKAQLETWWEDIKDDYKNDEIDLYYAYAKNVILNWTNRIVFSHLVKRNHVSASQIDKLDYICSPHEGNQIFREITDKGDYYNIYSEVLYNENLPQQTWDSFVALSLFLKSSPISELSQVILHKVLEESVNVSKRLINGQFPTPPILAELLSRMTIHNIHDNCFDGCCGTGTIPSFVIKYKKRYISAVESAETTWASDKFQFPLQIANLAMTSYESINTPCRLFKKDILSLMPGGKVKITTPQTGKKEIHEIPQFDSIISNLPFVKTDRIPKDDFKYVNIIKNQYGLNGRSDLSYYIALHLRNLVKEGGYVGIILSNSFLGTEAGSYFFQAIRNSFDDIRIHVSGTGRWFSNAKVVTVLLIMRRRSKIKQANDSISFFTWKKNLKEISENERYLNAIVNTSLMDKVTDNNIIKRQNYDASEVEGLRTLNIAYNSMFSDLKWLLNIRDKIIPLKSRLKVIRGSRRGYDKLFFPKSSNIESQFLKPAIKSLKQTKSFIGKADSKAFCCCLPIESLKEQNYYGAYSWIKKFEDVVDDYGPLVKRLGNGKRKWYELETKEIVEIGTMMNPNDRFFFVKFEEPTFINQRVIGLNRLNQADDINLIHALLNSILSLFYIEAVGFGRGLGALDVNKESIDSCYMLNPSLLSEEQKKEILKKFAHLVSRGVFDIDKELENPTRMEFDKVVLDAYGIGQYHNDIVNSLKTLRRVRLAVKG